MRPNPARPTQHARQTSSAKYALTTLARQPLSHPVPLSSRDSRHGHVQRSLQLQSSSSSGVSCRPLGAPKRLGLTCAAPDRRAAGFRHLGAAGGRLAARPGSRACLGPVEDGAARGARGSLPQVTGGGVEPTTTSQVSPSGRRATSSVRFAAMSAQLYSSQGMLAEWGARWRGPVGCRACVGS